MVFSGYDEPNIWNDGPKGISGTIYQMGTGSRRKASGRDIKPGREDNVRKPEWGCEASTYGKRLGQ